MWGRGEKSIFLRIFLNLNDYHFKAGRHSNGSICMNFMVTINQKHTIDSQKPKRKGLKHTTKKFIKS